MTQQPPKTPTHEDFDPGAKLCGHAPRHERHHYLGGGIWVCFACFAALLTGRKPEAAPCK